MKVTFLLAFLLTCTFSHAQFSVHTEEAVPIGGIEQYISIKGKDQSLPLLLFLHGGPGGSVMHYADNFTDKLQEHFVVVQWDQRETGRTRKQNPSPLPLNLSVFQNDTHELIVYLTRRFARQKLYLAAHSWGTALGFFIAQHYPDLLYAYIPIAPMIDQLESERIALKLMKEKALKSGNRKAFEELSLVNIPFGNGTQLFYHRKWLLDYAGSTRKLSKSYVDNWAATWLGVFNEASEINLIENLPTIGCPVYFFTGRRDYQTNSSITEKYFTKLSAPSKALFWFEASAHAVPTTEPDRLQNLIIGKILPETFAIQKPEAVIGQSVEP